jgi:deoxyribodipyrimidine photo-lyase
VSTLRGDGPDRSALADHLRGRAVWLVHPWALRDPAHDLAALGRVPGTAAGTIDGPPNDPVVIGVYPLEHHAVWPWPEFRWRWVDAAMAAVAPQRWALDAASLGAALAQAASVHAVDDPHVNGWLRAAAGDRLRLSAAPSLFPPVDRRCDSFSQWWTRATRGLKLAQELL